MGDAMHLTANRLAIGGLILLALVTSWGDVWDVVISWMGR
jgi:hypothetical protein